MMDRNQDSKYKRREKILQEAEQKKMGHGKKW